MKQRNHYNTHFTKHTFPITLVCDNVSNAPNIGALFRIADAFGVEKLILTGEQIHLGRKMKKTSRATENAIPHEIHENILPVVQLFKNNDHQIIALEITNNSIAINQYQLDTSRPIVLIVGDENFGISETVLDLCDTIIHIKMFGQNSSMNVVQATNIALYEFTKQFI